MTQTQIDPDVQYLLDLEAKLEGAAAASETVFCESDLEVDSGANVYRVWQGSKLLGTFYRSFDDGKWLAQPCCCRSSKQYRTPKLAKLAILRAWGL